MQHPAISLGIGLCCIINAEHPLITGWRSKSLVAACTAVGCKELAMTNDNEWVAFHCFFYNRWVIRINILIIVSIILESKYSDTTFILYCDFAFTPLILSAVAVPIIQSQQRQSGVCITHKYKLVIY